MILPTASAWVPGLLLPLKMALAPCKKGVPVLSTSRGPSRPVSLVGRSGVNRKSHHASLRTSPPRFTGRSRIQSGHLRWEPERSAHQSTLCPGRLPAPRSSGRGSRLTGCSWGSPVWLLSLAQPSPLVPSEHAPPSGLRAQGPRPLTWLEGRAGAGVGPGSPTSVFFRFMAS